MDASKDLDKRDIQTKLDAEAEAKHVLETANQKAKQRLRWGTIGLGIMLVVAVILGVFSVIADRKRTVAENQLAQIQTDKKRLETDKDRLETEKTTLERVRVKLAAESKTLTTQNQTLDAKNDTLETQNQDLAESAAQAEVKLQTAQSETTAAQTQAQEARAERTRIEAEAQGLQQESAVQARNLEDVIPMMGAVSLFAAGDKEGAMLRLSDLIEANPVNTGLRIVRGELYSQAEQPENALADFEKALELEPGNPIALLGKANASNDTTEALALYDQILQQDPEDTAALMNRGNRLAQRGQIIQAIESYTTALRIQPELGTANLKEALNGLITSQYSAAAAPTLQLESQSTLGTKQTGEEFATCVVLLMLLISQ